MKSIKKIISLIVLLLIGTSATSWAGSGLNVTEFIKPMSIIHLIVLLTSLVCLIWALKILSLVKGGLMSKSWQMFGLGFGVLIIAQLVSLGQSAKMITIPEFIAPGLYMIMVMTWLYGLYQTRKVLG